MVSQSTLSSGQGRRVPVDGREGELAGAPLAVPVEAVFLLPLVHRAAEKLLQYFEVDLPLCDGFGKECFELLDILRKDIGGFCFGIIWQLISSSEFLRYNSVSCLGQFDCPAV